MSERKIVVPEGMLEASRKGIEKLIPHPYESAAYSHAKAGLEAALHWLSENPIRPTEAQIKEVFGLVPSTPWPAIQQGFVEWQRRVFLAPEPAVPKPISDLALFIKEIISAPPNTKAHARMEDDLMKIVTTAYQRGLGAPELENTKSILRLIDGVKGVTR